MDELFPFLLFPLLEVTEDLLLEAFSCVLKRKFINSELLRPLIFFSIKEYGNSKYHNDDKIFNELFHVPSSLFDKVLYNVR